MKIPLPVYRRPSPAAPCRRKRSAASPCITLPLEAADMLPSVRALLWHPPADTDDVLVAERGENGNIAPIPVRVFCVDIPSDNHRNPLQSHQTIVCHAFF